MPTKVIDYSYICDAYEQSDRFLKSKLKGAEIPEKCATCRFLLFGQCWLEEFNKDDETVRRAIEGSYDALHEVHKRLEA